MRLLLITSTFPNPTEPTRGTFNMEMARALCHVGHQVDVVSPVSWVDEWRARREGLGIGPQRHEVVHGVRVYYPRYYYTPKVLRTCYGWFLWCSVRRTLLPLLQGGPPDALLAYWVHPAGAVAVQAARRIGKPCVIMVGGSDVLLLTKQPARRRCILRVLESADAVVAVSDDIKSRLCQFGIEPAKIHVVYRGVDREQFSCGERREARRRLGLPLDRPLLLWVGRMVPVKGLDVLVEACSILKARKTGFQAALVGAGPLEARLKAACVARGLGESVRFAGPALHHDLPDWYRAADLTVLPSLSEGVPNVLLESIACGTPFVASCVGGIPEIASQGIDRLVAPGDPLQLADAIGQQLARVTPQTDRCFRPESCAVAAGRLIDVIRSVGAGSQPHRAASAGRTAASRLGNLTPSWSWRQIARRAMVASVPKRFLIAGGPSKQRLVWLTFDDGPDPEHTPRLLDVLKANNVRATFFVIGAKVERHPDLVRRMAKEGHSVGQHTFSHRSFEEMSNRELLEEVRRTRGLLGGILGASPPFFRPPHGKLGIGSLCRLWHAGQQVVLWNVDPKDYILASTSTLLDWFRTNPLQAGDIVLLHDNRPYAAAVLPEVVGEARDRGLEFATFEHPAICVHR